MEAPTGTGGGFSERRVEGSATGGPQPIEGLFAVLVALGVDVGRGQPSAMEESPVSGTMALAEAIGDS